MQRPNVYYDDSLIIVISLITFVLKGIISMVSPLQVVYADDSSQTDHPSSNQLKCLERAFIDGLVGNTGGPSGLFLYGLGGGATRALQK